MSVDKVVDIIDNSSKNEDVRRYRLMLLARTLRAQDMMPEFLETLNKFLIVLDIVPDAYASVWLGYFYGFVLSAAASSSKNGWIMDILTQTRVSYKANNPDAKKMMNQRENTPEVS